MGYDFDMSELIWISAEDLPRVSYLVPDVDGEPRPKPVLADNFVTEDGRAPVYIRDESGARSEYWKLYEIGLIPLKPGRVLEEGEFMQLVRDGGGFEVVRRNDPNDDGYQMVWDEDEAAAAEYFQNQKKNGFEVRTLAEGLDEPGFVEMAVAGEIIDLKGKHSDNSVRIIRGVIIGASEGGGVIQPSLARTLFKK